MFFFFFQAEDGIRDYKVTGVQTCALPISVRCERQGPPEEMKLVELPDPVPAAGEAVVRLYACGLNRRDVWIRQGLRSEERRVGEEGRSRWSPYHLKKKKKKR